MTSSTWLHRLALGVVLPLATLSAPALMAAETSAIGAPAPSETDAAKAVRYTRALEAAPLAPDAMDMRRWLLRWVMDTPDYTIAVCPLLDLPEDDPPALAGELLVQMMGGNVAYQIEHGTGTDETSRQLAGVESMLRMYGAYLVSDAHWVVPALAPLLVEQRNGTLRAYVEKKVADTCTPGTGERMTLQDDAPSVPFLGGFLRESHVVYPLTVPTGWEMLGEHRYDEPRSGASVRFHRKGDITGWMDVYFYPIGVVDQDTLAKMAATERNQLTNAWKDAFTGAPLSPLSSFSVPVTSRLSVPTGRQPRPKSVTAYTADFSYIHSDNNKPYHSALVFMVDRLYAIKLRYSAEADVLSREQVRKEAEAFARHLLSQVEISSTGHCAAASMAVEGKMADGCVGEDPIQPAVLEGRRELRFEYPAPR